MFSLDRIETYRENARLEAKLATGGLPESLWETYSAFANSYGGVILLGVEERSDHSLRIQGLLDAQEMLEEFLTRVQDPQTVSADLVSEELARVESTPHGDIIVIEVPLGRSRPPSGLSGQGPLPRLLPPGGGGGHPLLPGGGGRHAGGAAELTPSFFRTIPSGEARFIMSTITKQALEASLKQMMLKKPLDKITIRDITEACGISRMTFYYHFKDIYDLVEWVCVEDASRALQGKKTYDTWQEGLAQIFEAVLENKPFVLNAFRCISRDQMERFLFHLTYGLIRGVVDEKSQGRPISEEDKAFIAEFYKYSFVGILLDWIRQGMSEDYRTIVRKVSATMHGNIANAIENFAAEA